MLLVLLPERHPAIYLVPCRDGLIALEVNPTTKSRAFCGTVSILDIEPMFVHIPVKRVYGL
jgi:hypothetical protein